MERQKEISFAISFLLVNFAKNEISDRRNTPIIRYLQARIRYSEQILFQEIGQNCWKI